MNSKQITIDQHFLPQCYLKNFTIHDWRVFVYNKNWQLLKRKYTPKSIWWKHLLYELNLDDPDNIIENFFSKIEDQYASLSEDLLSLKDVDVLSNLSEENQVSLLLFILRLTLWNLSQYDKINSDGFDDLWKRELLNHSLSIDEKKKSLQNLEEHNRRQLPLSILVAFTESFLSEIILRKKIIFVLSNWSKFFMTSDNPVIERRKRWNWVLGFTTLGDMNYCVALSPYIWIKIIDKEDEPNIKNLSLLHDKYWEICNKHNQQMFKQSLQFVYSDCNYIIK